MYLDTEQKVTAIIKKIFSFKVKLSHILALLLGVTATLYATDINLPYTFSEGEMISASKMNANFQVLLDKVNELENKIDGAPVGAIIPFGGQKENIPTGWLLCDGSEVSASQYPELFNAIGHSWGGNRLVNIDDAIFRLPDLRGKFLRGVDNGAGIDPDSTERTANYTGGNTGNMIGTYQNDAFQGHWHYYVYEQQKWLPGGESFYLGMGARNESLQTPYRYVKSAVRDAIADENNNGEPRISSETRPTNATINYMIKY